MSMKTKVLLVDDNLAVPNIARLFLLKAGLDVEVAGDGDAAVQMLADQAVNVLKTDMIMPGSLSGVELIVSTREHYPDGKCGLISGMVDGLIDKLQGNLKDLKILPKTFSKADIADFVRQLGERFLWSIMCLI